MTTSPQISDVIALHSLHMMASGYTDATQRQYADMFRLIIRWCNDHEIHTIHQLDAGAVRQYLTDLQARDLSTRYIHNHARTLRTLCNFAVAEGLIEETPFRRVKMPRVKQKVLPALSSVEIRTVLDATETERDRAIILTLLDTGLRASELCALDVGDLNGTDVLVRAGKGQKERTTHIGPTTGKQIQRYQMLERGRLRPDSPLFVSQRGGGRLTYQAISQLFRRLRKATGISTLSAHALRRTMAIYSLRNGMNIYVLARMMGHEGIHVLKQYLDIVQADVASSHARHGVVDNL